MMLFSVKRIAFILNLFLFHLLRADYTIDDASLFRIQFNKRILPDSSDLLMPTHGPVQEDFGVPPPPPPTAPLREESESLERVIMTTTNHERYSCVLPLVKGPNSPDEEEYTGPNALEILNKLFLTQSCAYRLEHYWTYELCHGRHIRQFHEEREGKEIKLTEYFLGKYNADTFNKDVEHLEKQKKDGALRKPHKKRIETTNMPFYQLEMKDGTLCDLNGQPRTTRVNYVCYPAGKHEMYSFKESSTCEYDIIVLSPILCQHPDYRPEESTENVIDCRPLDEKSPYKPRNLIQMEAESLKLRSEKMFEGNFMPGTDPGTVKIEIKQVRPEDWKDDEDLENDIDDYKNSNWPKSRTSQEPFKPLMDPEIVKEFLMGEYCLFGGSGWWKYEFCYGKKIDQYHDEKNGEKTVINLGRFDVEKHIKWIDENPQKRPKQPEIRKHVSHFYSGGDVCDKTNQPRTVEVKLKCKKSDSPSTVSLYLLEPKVCEYILGVESPLVCDILHSADDYSGLMELTKPQLNRLGIDSNAEETYSSEKESTDFKTDFPMPPKQQQEAVVTTTKTERQVHSTSKRNLDNGQQLKEEHYEEVVNTKTETRTTGKETKTVVEKVRTKVFDLDGFGQEKEEEIEKEVLDHEDDDENFPDDDEFIDDP